MQENEHKRKIPIGFIVLSIFLIIGGIVGGIFIGRNTNSLTEEEQKLVDGYRLLKEDWLYGNEEAYLGDVAAKSLINGIAQNKNDNFTFYTSTSAEQGLSTDGNGFGFSSHYYDGGLYITDVSLDSTSYRAGLRKKDVLYSVKIASQDEFFFKEHSYSEINAKLSSVNDTTTSFEFHGIRYLEKEKKDIVITFMRGHYQENLVEVIQTPLAENDKCMIIKVNTFLGNPTAALDGCLKDYYSNHQIEKLVLDLRGNGGGYVSQASEMAKLFVKKNTLIYQLRNKDGRILEETKQTKDPKYEISQYAIITDQNTASASEIFTLAMLAGSNTFTYGFKSYGKGIAQSFKTFSDGSVIRYTYAKVYGPNRDDTDTICIHGVGIQPDHASLYDYTSFSYTTDYSSIGISENGQNFFLEVVNKLYEQRFPSSYSAKYHFTDAVSEYARIVSEKYQDESLLVGFNENGGMYKPLNDILNKELFDRYQIYYDELTVFASQGA